MRYHATILLTSMILALFWSPAATFLGQSCWLHDFRRRSASRAEKIISVFGRYGCQGLIGQMLGDCRARYFDAERGFNALRHEIFSQPRQLGTLAKPRDFRGRFRQVGTGRQSVTTRLIIISPFRRHNTILRFKRHSYVNITTIAPAYIHLSPQGFLVVHARQTFSFAEKEHSRVNEYPDMRQRELII